MEDEVRPGFGEDVRRGLELAKGDPPPWNTSVDAFVQAGRRLRRANRQRWAAGTSAMVTAVLGLGLAVPHAVGSGRGAVAPAASGPAAGSQATRSDGRQSGADGSAVAGMRAQTRPFAFTLRSYDVGAFHVADPVVAARDYQRAPVYQDGKTQAVRTEARQADLRASQADLVVYRPGRYQPAGFTANAKAVRIGGQWGLQETTDTATLLAWSYAEDAWATLETVRGADQDVVAALPSIAEGLTGGVEVPAMVPVVLPYLPGGYSLVEAGVRGRTGPQTGIPASDPGRVAVLRFDRAVASHAALALGQAGPNELQVSLLFDERSTQPVPVASTPVCTQVAVCRRLIPGTPYRLEASGGQLSAEELSRILLEATVGSVDDPTSWTPVTEGIPGVR